jgi:hypothetical protein
MNLKKFANALADFCLDNPDRALGTVTAIEFGAWYAKSRAKGMSALSSQSELAATVIDAIGRRDGGFGLCGKQTDLGLCTVEKGHSGPCCGCC